jgi:xanthine dehydrogenase accessory factor
MRTLFGGTRPLVVVRGAGDLATGTIVRLLRCGFAVVALEVPNPSAIRRGVSLSEAVYDGRAVVEGVEARLAADPGAALRLLGEGFVPLLVDPDCHLAAALGPFALVDAILAKRNLGTSRGMAAFVVALGPGFEAGVDADAVVETNRGHDLGRVILAGRAEADTGLPGSIGGKTDERVLRSLSAGRAVALRDIGDTVRAGEAVLAVEGKAGRTEVVSAIDGVLRGLIRPGYELGPGFKVADVDPRGGREHCFTITDKSRAVAGGVLEAILGYCAKGGTSP